MTTRRLRRAVRLRLPAAGVRRRASVEFEVIASLALAITLAIVFVVAVLQYAQVRRETDTRRLLELAAAAELDCIRAGLHPLPAEDAGPPPPPVPGRVVVHATASPGTGVWQGLTQVRVTARQPISARRTITVELAAYVATGGTP